MACYGKFWTCLLNNSKSRWFRVQNYRIGYVSHEVNVLKYTSIECYRPGRAVDIGLSRLKAIRHFSSVAGPSSNVAFLNQRSLGHCRTLGCTLLIPEGNALGLMIYRGKKSKRKGTPKTQDESSDDDEDDEDWEVEIGHDYNDIKARVPSLRLDSVLKAGLGMSRNKVENAFYDSKIRVNGKKVLKKSKQVEEGDEIDVIKGTQNSNPDLINVARVVILKVGSYEEESDKQTVKLRRYQNLLIRRYGDSTDEEL